MSVTFKSQQLNFALLLSDTKTYPAKNSRPADARLCDFDLFLPIESGVRVAIPSGPDVKGENLMSGFRLDSKVRALILALLGLIVVLIITQFLMKEPSPQMPGAPVTTDGKPVPPEAFKLPRHSINLRSIRVGNPATAGKSTGQSLPRPISGTGQQK